MPVNRAQTRGFEYVSGFGEGVTPRGDREQVVFRYASDRCPDDEFHIPDAPVRAFRDDRGRVQLMLASRHTRRMIGSDLASVAVDPAHRVVLPSHDEPEVSSYDNLEWIASLYTTDGRTIHALVHNEYQGWKHAPEECETEVACWFNAITLATSTDGGERYVHRSAPEHRIAGFPRRYVPNTGPVGYFMPSNIVARDGWCYALVRALNGRRDDPAYPDQPRGDCLIRSADPSDPHSWRGWDGSEF